MTPQQAALTTPNKSGLSLYREIAVGGGSWPHFIAYEFVTTFFSNLPGALGLASRSILYPLLFNKCGKKVALGRSVTVRNPRAINLGSRIIVDDFAVLDVRGNHGEISLEDHVSIGRFSTLTAKHGKISLAQAVNVGSYCRIATQSCVEIGASTLIAAYCYIGPGNHKHQEGKELIASEMEIKGGVKIGEHVWIGAHSTIMDGVTIGDGAIIGAHSLVKDNVAAGEVVAGVPAKNLAKKSAQ